MKQKFAAELLDNLNHNILPYWIDTMTDPRGGYYGRRDGHDRLDADAPKGAILNARILWSFSAAYLAMRNPAYLQAADRAYNYIVDHFVDREYGGTFWSVNPDGSPADTKKQFYAIGFMIYGLSEYYRASGYREALRLALDLFDVIETHSLDTEKEGYIEATTRSWQPIADMRLSDRDANASKTMNTHLHIIEGYTNLLRTLRDLPEYDKECRRVDEATRRLLRLFLDRITNPVTHHLTLFFDDDWRKVDDAESYGHDIEASWLLLETAEVIADEALYAETLERTRHIALAGLQGRCADGSMVYERLADGRYLNNKDWWVQAENVIGQLYLWRYHGLDEWLPRAYQSWRYIADNIVSPEGEWFWARLADGSIDRADDKAGFWKCPYHNSRMTLEASRLLLS